MFENPADDVITFQQCAGKYASFCEFQKIGSGAGSALRKSSRNWIARACGVTSGGFWRSAEGSDNRGLIVPGFAQILGDDRTESFKVRADDSEMVAWDRLAFDFFHEFCPNCDRIFWKVCQ